MRPARWLGRIVSFGELRSSWQHQPAGYRHARHAVGVSHTAPHIDREETMLRATDILLPLLARRSIRPLMGADPVLMPGERSSTTEWEPGKRLWAQLPALNREPGVLDVSMLVGYVWADEPRSTAAVVSTGTAPDNQRRVAAGLLAILGRTRRIQIRD